MQVKWTQCITSHVPQIPQHVPPSQSPIPFCAARTVAPQFPNVRTSFAFDATFRHLPKRLSSMHLSCAGDESGYPDRSEEPKKLDEPYPVEIFADEVAMTAADVDAPSIMASLEELVLSKEEIVERVAELLGGESSVSADTATDLVAKLDGNSRASLLTALFASGTAATTDATRLCHLAYTIHTCCSSLRHSAPTFNQPHEFQCSVD